jgi:transcriptional regulator with PAS, ATPase and Fis domain
MSLMHQSGPATQAVRGHAIFIRRFEVVVIDGPDRDARAVSSDDELTIGTAAGCHVQLSDGSVSRHHCAIRACARGLELRDLGSTNGTFIGDHEVVRGYVRSGSRIRIGTTTITVAFVEDELEQPLAAEDRYGDLIGGSSAMRRLYPVLDQCAASDASILLQGETGTGKELVAMMLHRSSPRAARPLVPINCAAIPETLIEGELFGYERGAFSGASRAYPGKLRLADGGTLFLDEVGELSLAAQSKILRAIESGEVFPIGSSRPCRVDVRIIAATNRDLRAGIAPGDMRADLFYRLAVVQLFIPPLRERRDDIAAIAEGLLTRICAELKLPRPALSAAFIAALRSHDWPGNVREMRNAIEHALVTAAWPDRLQPDDLPPTVDRAALAADAGEREVLLGALARSAGKKAGAARALNCSRTTLYRRLERAGLGAHLVGAG